MEQDLDAKNLALADLIRKLESAIGPLLEAANQRDSARFSALLARNEEQTKQLLQRLEAGERDRLSAEQRATLKRLLATREEVQQQVASWADHVKEELKALSHSSKLHRQYKG
ncbi:flagellar protein FliT [Chromobacterium paludis]|nr:flagellar protein FliT [Chromobacterium paludis]